MSYQDLYKRGMTVASSSQALPSTKQAEGLVFKLASQVAQLKKLVDQLGSPRDTQDHRHRIAEANRQIQDLARDAKAQLTVLHDAAPASAAQSSLASASGPGQAPSPGAAAAASAAADAAQLKTKKLLQDFAAILVDYKSTQRIAAEREAATLPKPSPPSKKFAAAAGALPPGASGSASELQEVVVSEQQALLQQQKQRDKALLENAIQYNEALIEERDEGIKEIQRQIGEVNEMFQDLAVLINDQGHQVRTVDEHIESTAERVKEGTRDLIQAERSQRATRNRCLWLWLLLALIVSLLLIILMA